MIRCRWADWLSAGFEYFWQKEALGLGRWGGAVICGRLGSGEVPWARCGFGLGAARVFLQSRKGGDLVLGRLSGGDEAAELGFDHFGFFFGELGEEVGEFACFVRFCGGHESVQGFAEVVRDADPVFDCG